jgi:IclR family transcriptional regulator, blcABC operon repressor
MRIAVQENGSAKGSVPAVAKAVRLLDALAAAKEPLSLAALTQELALPKSTVHALCATLAQAGLVTRFASGSYHLGMHIMDWSHAFLARTDLTVEFVKLWDSLALLPEETIILSVLDGADVVYVACRNGTRPLGLNFRIGMRLPANCTASGKALLSTLPRQRLEDLGRDGGLGRLTRKSVTDVDQLGRQLAQVRKRGYSVDDEETRDGMICFGAPVFDSSSGQAAAGVGVSLYKSALTKRQKLLAIQAVQKLASALSQRLGARALSIGGSA